MPARDSRGQRTKEHAEKVKRKRMDRTAEKWYVGSFHCGSKPIVGEIQETSVLGRQERKIQVRSRPSSEERWRHRPVVKDEEGYRAVFTDQMTEAPRLSRLPEEECPQMWIRVPPRQTAGITLTILWFLLARFYTDTHSPISLVKTIRGSAV